MRQPIFFSRMVRFRSMKPNAGGLPELNAGKSRAVYRNSFAPDRKIRARSDACSAGNDIPRLPALTTTDNKLSRACPAMPRCVHSAAPLRISRSKTTVSIYGENAYKVRQADLIKRSTTTTVNFRETRNPTNQMLWQRKRCA